MALCHLFLFLLLFFSFCFLIESFTVASADLELSEVCLSASCVLGLKVHTKCLFISWVCSVAQFGLELLVLLLPLRMLGL